MYNAHVDCSADRGAVGRSNPAVRRSARSGGSDLFLAGGSWQFGLADPSWSGSSYWRRPVWVWQNGTVEVKRFAGPRTGGTGRGKSSETRRSGERRKGRAEGRWRGGRRFRCWNTSEEAAATVRCLPKVAADDDSGNGSRRRWRQESSPRCRWRRLTMAAVDGRGANGGWRGMDGGRRTTDGGQWAEEGDRDDGWKVTGDGSGRLDG